MIAEDKMLRKVVLKPWCALSNGGDGNSERKDRVAIVSMVTRTGQASTRQKKCQFPAKRKDNFFPCCPASDSEMKYEALAISNFLPILWH